MKTINPKPTIKYYFWAKMCFRAFYRKIMWVVVEKKRKEIIMLT